MKIEIINCAHKSFWYYNKIGKQYDVEEYNKSKYCIVKDPNEEADMKLLLIHKKDTKIIPTRIKCLITEITSNGTHIVLRSVLPNLDFETLKQLQNAFESDNYSILEI